MSRRPGLKTNCKFPGDFLRKEHHRAISAERKQLGELGFSLWHLVHVPFPMDANTVAAIDGFRENFVLPRPLVEAYIEEWCFPSFRVEAASFRESLLKGRKSRNLTERAEVDSDMRHWPEAPELNAFRVLGNGPSSEHVLGEWEMEFAVACGDAFDLIFRGLMEDYSELKGSYLQLPFLPLGGCWTSFVPLVDHVWLDLRLVELCETAARLQRVFVN